MGLGKNLAISCRATAMALFVRGYDPNIKLERKQTIMGGASCCTFRYRYEAEKPLS